MLENVVVDSSVPVTVKAGGSNVLTGSIVPGSFWIRGSVYSANAAAPSHSSGALITTSRPSTLVSSTGFYQTVIPPTYTEYNVSQVVNVKDVSGHPVAGDGVTDDTVSLQAILTSAAGKQLLYFPHGIYLLSDTLLVPPGSRLVGESFTEFSATGSKFKDAKNLTPMIKVGSAGDVEVAQFTDFIFTIADILPGTVMVEVNMAGDKPGNVGFFNCHCRRISQQAHLPPGGGFLVESQNGMWMLGIGIEHQTLYQMNIYNAKNVFLGIQQGEAVYWQGNGSTLLAPAPWADSALPSDPTWSWCAANDAQCRMGLYQHINNSSNINVYSGGFWNFVSGPSRTFCSVDCEDNTAMYENNSKLYSYGISTINTRNLILESGVDGDKDIAAVPRTANSGATHDGFPTGIMAAYLRQTG